MTADQLAAFIREKVTKREKSLFQEDVKRYGKVIREALNGKSVLVIGGAGTIGKAYLEEILSFQPKRLVVIDWNENGLAELTRDLRSRAKQYIPPVFRTYPFDFGSVVFHRYLEREGPFDVVAHFAAHKHVRTEKDVYATEAMLRNNLLSAYLLMKQLQRNPPGYFFSVSTDKASAPANIMGASKKLMEEAILTYSSLFHATTARFANVAFSNGSLAQAFLKRLKRRQPLVAPENIQRFFVSPAEAGQLCLLASLTAESGDVLFPRLDRSEQLSFSQMAEDLLSFLGMEAQFCSSEEEAREFARVWRPGMPYPIYLHVANTSGEKQEEHFYTAGELVSYDRYHQLGVIHKTPKYRMSDWEAFADSLETLFQNPNLNKAGVVEFLEGYLPEFNHLETGRKLDDRM